jgi:hypothetical protein
MRDYLILGLFIAFGIAAVAFQGWMGWRDIRREWRQLIENWKRP